MARIRAGGGGTLGLFDGAGASGTTAHSTGSGQAGRRMEAARDPAADERESQHRAALGDAMHARQNKRAAILAYFAERPGWRISSAELHREFGSSFRSRVSEINRDPASPIRIANQTTPGPDGEHSYYYAVPRASAVLDAGHAKGADSQRAASSSASSAAPPSWIAAHECGPRCRCFHHTFCGPGGAPCIACP